ncbi:MAG TPA: hypothetical protein PL070_02105 [Flavobacteriales bacterium]|nr:hypothetical protein [Flavobacteriales bacterium]
MSEPWYRTSPALLEVDRQRVLQVQPKLVLIDTGDAVLFRGPFLIEECGKVHEQFDVEIEISRKSQVDIPVVREVAGRIPRQLDPHHVIKDDGTLCVVLPEAYWYNYPKGLRLDAFMAGPLRSNLAGQALVLQGLPWPQKEWPHAADGSLAFYREILGADDLAAVRLMLMLAKGSVKGHRECPCGSGAIVRNCHRDAIWKASERIPRELVRRALHELWQKRQREMTPQNPIAA